MTSLSCVFLDRDGTLNVKAPEGEYVTRPEDLRLLDGAAEAVRRLNEAAVLAVVVTNQRGVARGRMSWAGVQSVNAELQRQLAGYGAHLDAVYVCPHAGGCPCRKPRPGLVAQAVADHPGIDLTHSVVVGDGDCDVELGKLLGITTVRVGGSRAVDSGASASAADSLMRAVESLLARDRVRGAVE